MHLTILVAVSWLSLIVTGFFNVNPEFQAMMVDILKILVSGYLGFLMRDANNNGNN